MVDFQDRSRSMKLAFFFRYPMVAIALTMVVAAVIFAANIALAARWHEQRFATFFASLIAVTCVTALPGVGRPLAAGLIRISALLSKRGSFRSNPVEEAPKFALIRIAFGVLLVIRSYWLIHYMTPQDWSMMSVAAPAVFSMICGILVASGFLTQPALAFLILFQWQTGDELLGTATLGNDVAALMSLLLLFANAGAHISVDSVIRKRQSVFGRLIAATYYRFGLPSEATLQIAKLLTLFGYWCVCVYSLSIHLGEQAWMHGIAGPQLLSNNFMTRFGTEFAALFQSSEIAVQLARIALWGMLPWYLLLLPCVLIGGPARQYAIVWGLLFFSLSLVVLRLGWLAEFEFLFFAALFWQKAFIGGPKSIQVAYDDRCNLCDRTVAFIKAVDIFNRVDLKPLSKNHRWLLENSISPDDAQKDLYGIKAGRKAAKGYDFYLMLSSEVLLLIPFYPILLLGQHLGGRAIYRYVADRRTQLFGVCKIPSPKVEHSYQPDEYEARKSIQLADPIVIFAAHMVILGAAYLATVKTPYVFFSAPAPIQAGLEKIAPLGDAAHIYGVAPIDVFNRTDLRMAENWFTISKIDAGNETLLPILDEEGKRLDAHRSDRIYFGNTLLFRRGVIGTKECEFEDYRESVEYLTRSVSGVPGLLYRYRQYFQPLPKDALLRSGKYEIQTTSIVCEAEFSVPS
nr:hypothetical protein REQ54_00849 [Rhizobium sp. Q54]